jgi:NADH-quinone oxidoreductase subunit L
MDFLGMLLPMAKCLAMVAVFLPLIAGCGARLLVPSKNDRLAQLLTCGALVVSAVLANLLLLAVVQGGHAVEVPLANWITVGSFTVNWALHFDVLAAVMVAMVTTVSACVHIYAVGYMAHDPEVPRFMGYLSLFTFFMLMLVTADNLVQMFLGWEGVGLASYLLIGFWNSKASANKASIKAFVVNRVGDLGFLLGIFMVWGVFGTLEFEGIFAALSSGIASQPAIELIGLLLLIGAMGKSAQFGLHVWLPDAMEGPTPVSALIHAATMVTAGVFMICRLSPLYAAAPMVGDVITVLGVVTALFAAFVGLTQHDIKRVIAYSTCSQLGYMFFAAGVGAYNASMFHLVTHAFFKALLFLGAGSVIHAVGGEQDIRRMGGLRRYLPYTYPLFLIGSLALCGIYPFAGYFSKDAILEAAYHSASPVAAFAYVGGLLAAFMTAFYSFRLIIMVFFGEEHGGDAHGPDHNHSHGHPHESPLSMLIPLAVLGVGAVVGGTLLEPWFMHDRGGFWQHSLFLHPHEIEGAPFLIRFAPTSAALLGIVLAWLLYVSYPTLPARIAAAIRPLYQLSFHKAYIDELYVCLIVRPLEKLGRLFWRDDATIDRFGPNGAANLTVLFGKISLRWQSGLVYEYVIAMVIGLMLALSLQAYSGGDIRPLLSLVLR